MAIDIDVEETLRRLTATEEAIADGASLNVAAGGLPDDSGYSFGVGGYPYREYVGAEEDHEFKGTLQYVPTQDQWRWTLYRRHYYGWRQKKVGWERVESGFANHEKAADVYLREACLRHRQRSERTVLL